MAYGGIDVERNQSQIFLFIFICLSPCFSPISTFPLQGGRDTGKLPPRRGEGEESPSDKGVWLHLAPMPLEGEDFGMAEFLLDRL